MPQPTDTEITLEGMIQALGEAQQSLSKGAQEQDALALGFNHEQGTNFERGQQQHETLGANVQTAALESTGQETRLEQIRAASADIGGMHADDQTSDLTNTHTGPRLI